MKVWPTLYRKSATGTIQAWSLSVLTSPSGDVSIQTAWGQVGTATPQYTSDSITAGKNTGKANATTPYEQALAEAESKWLTQKKKKGYVESIEAAEAGQVDEIIKGGIFPMLADKYASKKKAIVYPGYVQPKYDGLRCIGIVENGQCTLWSRTRKQITSVPHIEQALVRLANGKDFIFDGELYNHDYRDNFEIIVSLVRQKDPALGHQTVQYYIYDLPSIPGGFSERFAVLSQLFAAVHQDSPLRAVETVQVNSESETQMAYSRFLDQGYEGAMFRAANGPYLQHATKRSIDLLKIKQFDDAEFEIVGVREGRGKMADKGIFVCKTAEDKEFEVKMKGELENLKVFLENSEEYIGRKLTVQYQGFTSANNVPRFPVGLRIREDI